MFAKKQLKRSNATRYVAEPQLSHHGHKTKRQYYGSFNTDLALKTCR